MPLYVMSKPLSFSPTPNCLSAEILIKLGRSDEAKAIYETLVQRNPENWQHYEGLVKTSRPSNEEERIAIYLDVAEKHPRAAAPKRIAMNFATGKLSSSNIRP